MENLINEMSDKEKKEIERTEALLLELFAANQCSFNTSFSAMLNLSLKIMRQNDISPDMAANVFNELIEVYKNMKEKE